MLYKALQLAARYIRDGCKSAAEVRDLAISYLQARPEFRVEYLEVVDAESMSPVEQIAGPVRVAVAAWLGTVRLIDNVKA